MTDERPLEPQNTDEQQDEVEGHGGLGPSPLGGPIGAAAHNDEPEDDVEGHSGLGPRPLN
jgi:hypothetical protein